MLKREDVVYLVDGCRSPIGRGHPEKGAFRNLRADELTVQVLDVLIKRLEINPAEIEDVLLGCVGQHLEQGKNLARLVILLAGLPETIPGITLNRLCGSSFSAVQQAADSIASGRVSLALAGGVEHMGHVSMTAALDYHPRLFQDADFQWSNMGLTAEKLAVDYQIPREDQDRYALESNDRYFKALEDGFFNDEIVPITTPDGLVERDEQPRQSTLDILATLKTPFKENGTVTAANSSGIGDGAGMALIASEAAIRSHNWEPLARIVDGVAVGLSPERMGLGPVPAIQKLLTRNRLTLDQIDLFEINEAFAVQMLACLQELGLSMDRVNIHGGAVALGHPLGMSGVRIILTLARSLKQSGARLGVAAMCVGHGQGVAMLMERT
jgi:acetyl-CoA acetyltransferase family protein